MLGSRPASRPGIRFNPDFNGGERAGCGLYQVTNRDGRRSSAATAYVRPAELRSNINVITDTQALRLVVREQRAFGIEAWHRGTRRLYLRPAARSSLPRGRLELRIC